MGNNNYRLQRDNLKQERNNLKNVINSLQCDSDEHESRFRKQKFEILKLRQENDDL